MATKKKGTAKSATKKRGVKRTRAPLGTHHPDGTATYDLPTDDDDAPDHPGMTPDDAIESDGDVSDELDDHAHGPELVEAPLPDMTDAPGSQADVAAALDAITRARTGTTTAPNGGRGTDASPVDFEASSTTHGATAPTFGGPTIPRTPPAPSEPAVPSGITLADLNWRDRKRVRELEGLGSDDPITQDMVDRYATTKGARVRGSSGVTRRPVTRELTGDTLRADDAQRGERVRQGQDAAQARVSAAREAAELHQRGQMLGTMIDKALRFGARFMARRRGVHWAVSPAEDADVKDISAALGEGLAPYVGMFAAHTPLLLGAFGLYTLIDERVQIDAQIEAGQRTAVMPRPDARDVT